jgi:hypothetical protein
MDTKFTSQRRFVQATTELGNICAEKEDTQKFLEDAETTTDQNGARRTLAVVQNERDKRMDVVQFPAGFPLGPFATRELLFEECQRWAGDPDVRTRQD